MKASVADAVGMDVSPNGVACDTRAPIYFCAVTRGRCGRVRPIISCRFTAVTVSDGRSPTGVSKGIDHRVSVAEPTGLVR